jgi:hypothetical protein
LHVSVGQILNCVSLSGLSCKCLPDPDHLALAVLTVGDGLDGGRRLGGGPGAGLDGGGEGIGGGGGPGAAGGEGETAGEGTAEEDGGASQEHQQGAQEAVTVDDLEPARGEESEADAGEGGSRGADDVGEEGEQEGSGLQQQRCGRNQQALVLVCEGQQTEVVREREELLHLGEGQALGLQGLEQAGLGCDCEQLHRTHTLDDIVLTHQKAIRHCLCDKFLVCDLQLPGRKEDVEVSMRMTRMER